MQRPFATTVRPDCGGQVCLLRPARDPAWPHPRRWRHAAADGRGWQVHGEFFFFFALRLPWFDLVSRCSSRRLEPCPLCIHPLSPCRVVVDLQVYCCCWCLLVGASFCAYAEQASKQAAAGATTPSIIPSLGAARHELEPVGASSAGPPLPPLPSLSPQRFSAPCATRD